MVATFSTSLTLLQPGLAGNLAVLRAPLIILPT